MNLPDGGRRQRLGFDLGEDLLGRAAQLAGQLEPDLIPGHWRNPLLELGKFHRPVGGHQVGPGGEHLPQLDEGRAEVFQRQTQVIGAGVGSLTRAVPQQAPVEGQVAPQTQFHHQVAQPMAGQGGGDLAVAVQESSAGGAHGNQAETVLVPSSPRRRGSAARTTCMPAATQIAL